MDPRVFLLICLATASRHQPSASLEVDPNDPQNYTYNETDFQELRDGVNSAVVMYHWPRVDMWPSFLKAHPEEGLDLFKKLATDDNDWQIRQGACVSPAWPMLLETHNAEAWQLFQKLAKDQDNEVRESAAYSPAWPMLLETHNAEAWQLFQKLATDDNWKARSGAAISPAWPMLLQTHTAEARRLFEKLAQDKDEDVRKAAAVSPEWPDLVKSNLWESWQVLAELMSNRTLLHLAGLAKLARSPAWKAFGNVPLTGVAEHLKSFTPANLHEMAMSAQKVADNGFRHKVKDLPVVKGVATTLQRSSNETWLGEMAELPLLAGNAAQRVSPTQDISTVLTSKFEYPAKE